MNPPDAGSCGLKNRVVSMLFQLTEYLCYFSTQYAHCNNFFPVQDTRGKAKPAVHGPRPDQAPLSAAALFKLQPAQEPVNRNLGLHF